MHWGGGTPTFLTPEELRHLGAVVHDTFDLEPGAEVAAEIDPRVTTVEQPGYRSIGMDHFALPEDELGRALRTAPCGATSWAIRCARDWI